MSKVIATSRQRVSDFLEHVNKQQAKIRTLGDKAWLKTPSTGEVEIIRQFLSKPDCGTALLNRELTPLLSRNGWVVKFASIFLHQKPKVEGWKESTRGPTSKRVSLGKNCELGDLQTIFLYLTSDKTVVKIRSVVFQAKVKPMTVDYVIKDRIQRQLYDVCEGFKYESLQAKADRRLPSGPNRVRALQYLFVGKKPVRARTLPADIALGAFVGFGEHLLRFLNDSTGLEVRPEPDDSQGWNRIVWDMIEEVAKSVTSKGMPRNEGLRAVLNHFNSFENHDIFYVGSDQATNDGFGVQLVIVWDSRLGRRSTETVQVPKLLLKIAETYDTTHIADERKRIEMKDQWIDEMAALIDQKVSRRAVADLAKSTKSNGLIGALGEAAFKSRESGDERLLIELIPVVSWKHSFKRLLRALLSRAERGEIDAEQMETLLNLLHEHPLATAPHVNSLVSNLVEALNHQLESHNTTQEQSIELEQG
jgi:hypothetical protein